MEVEKCCNDDFLWRCKINKYEEEKSESKTWFSSIGTENNSRPQISLLLLNVFRVNIVQKDIGKPTAMTVCARARRYDL